MWTTSSVSAERSRGRNTGGRNIGGRNIGGREVIGRKMRGRKMGGGRVCGKKRVWSGCPGVRADNTVLGCGVAERRACNESVYLNVSVCLAMRHAE